MTDKEIIFCDVSNLTGIEDGVIQHEPLEYQKVGAGFILRTRMEHPKEHIQKLKQKILENQEKAKELDRLMTDEYVNAIQKNKSLSEENQKLKEDAELDQDIDWGDDGQRYCPTHKKSYHLYCKECKLEIKQLRKEIQNLKSILDKAGGSN